MSEERLTNVDLRRHQRILVPSASEIRVTASAKGARFEGVVTVIGLSGMFIRANSPPSIGSVLYLQVTSPSVSFASECVVRHVTPNGMGVELTSLTPENEQKLKELLFQLKV